jgi:hypothetical protein
MSSKSLSRILLLFILFVSFLVIPAYADEPAKTEAPNSLDLKLTAGADLRLRQEIWTNTVFLGTINPATHGPWQNDRNFFRLRASVWAKLEYEKMFDAYAKVTTEPKYYGGPYHPMLVGDTHGQYWDQDEVIADNLYISGKKLFNGLIDFRVGRQDFLSPDDIYGEGFLIMDGTPGDGSRTFYFNAAKMRVNFTKDNSVDLVYINDGQTDRFMPSMHPSIRPTNNALYTDSLRWLSTSHEQGFMIYGRNRFEKIATFDPYYIYKIEDGFGTNPRLKLHTVGGRATVSYKGWRAKAEVAYQFGQYDSNSTYSHGIDRTGLGGYAFVGRKFDELPGKPEIDIGVVYYSGDDPKDPSDKRKAFDPLFSRFPSWNELYVYTLIPENSARYANSIPGYWTNLGIGMVKAKVNITSTTVLNLTYQYLMAPQKTSGLTTSMFSNSSRDRGHLPTAILTQKIMKNLDGMLQFEYFVPGKFYASNAKDAIFFRSQLQYKF